MPTLSEILGGIIIALVIALLGLALVIHFESEKIDNLEALNGAADAANTACTAQVTKQNKAVLDLQLGEKAMTVAAAKAQKQAVQRDSGLKRRIVDLQAAKPTGDACVAADALFNTYIGGK